jgi:Mn-dependent DtxR family transcriptional regulator
MQFSHHCISGAVCFLVRMREIENGLSRRTGKSREESEFESEREEAGTRRRLVERLDLSYQDFRGGWAGVCGNYA